MKKSLWVALLVASASSCAPTMVLLRNNKGEIVRCEAPRGPYDGLIAQNQAMDSCIEQYQTAGYSRVDGK